MASSSPSKLPSSLGRLSLNPLSPLTPSLTPEMKDGEYSNWSELPSELMSSIMQRLGVIEILEDAQRVCMSWRHVCKDPAMWRKIVMQHSVEDLGYDLEIMCRHAVHRSQGGLVEIEIWDFGTDSLINYIADRSSNLRSLKLAKCSQISNKGLTEALVKLPFLEELEVSYCPLWGGSMKVVCQSSPNLKTLKLNRIADRRPRNNSDDDALAIAETMHGLHNLQLFGNKLTDAGLNAILDSFPNLEHLDLRQCFNVNIVGDLEKRCSERIKVLRRPNDSTEDYPYGDMALNMILADYDYLYDFMPDTSFNDFYSSGSDSSDYGRYHNEPHESYDDF